MELVKITEMQIGAETTNSVNARDLWKALESKQDFSTWIKSRLDTIYAVENADFVCFHKKMEANNATLKEYVLTIESAKNIAMLERNEIGNKIRKYFIECEKNLNKHQLPQTYAEALMELALAEKEKERLALESQTRQKTIDLLTHTNKTYTMTEIAKELNLKSAIELNSKLCELKIQYKVNGTWVMYSEYSNRGFELIKQEVLDNGRVIYHRRITQIGREFILKLIQGAENELDTTTNE